MRFLEYVKIFVEWGLRVSQYVSPSQKGKVPSQFACCWGEGKFNPMKKRIDSKDSSWSSYQNEGRLNKDKDEDLVNYCVCPKSKRMKLSLFCYSHFNFLEKTKDLWKIEDRRLKTCGKLKPWKFLGRRPLNLCMNDNY